MRMVFSGLESAIEIECGRLTSLYVLSPTLFARVCQSLVSGKGESAVEPYSLWDGEKCIKSKDAFLPVFNPFELPWGHKQVGGKLFARFESLFLEDEEARLRIEEINQSLKQEISYYGMKLTSDYSFDVAWSMTKYLKAFSFGVERNEDDPLLDSLIKFMSLMADVGSDTTLALINFKRFLSENDLKELAEQSFFLNLPVLLLENGLDDPLIEGEKKTVIDQYFLESLEESPVRLSAPLQEEICSKGFGAVTI